MSAEKVYAFLDPRSPSYSTFRLSESDILKLAKIIKLGVLQVRNDYIARGGVIARPYAKRKNRSQKAGKV